MKDLKKKKLAIGRPLNDPHVESFALDWALTQRSNKFAVSGFNVAVAMKKAFPVKYEHESIDSIRKKVYRIMNRFLLRLFHQSEVSIWFQLPPTVRIAHEFRKSFHYNLYEDLQPR